MAENLNSGYGQAKAGGIPFTTGKAFFVDDSSGANLNAIDGLFTPDSDGVARRFSTVTLALAACVTDHGDIIVLAPDFATALSAAELLAAETKGVKIISALADKDGLVTAYRATGVLAQTADLSLFTITGRVELIQIIGVVTTVIETQANATLLKINPTVGADVDVCAALDISADAVGSIYSITGTLSDALINTVSGAAIKQASPVVLEAGILELECAASNTGSVKWMVQYKPVDAGARVIATA